MNNPENDVDRWLDERSDAAGLTRERFEECLLDTTNQPRLTGHLGSVEELRAWLRTPQGWAAAQALINGANVVASHIRAAEREAQARELDKGALSAIRYAF